MSRLESSPEGVDPVSWFLRSMRREAAYYFLITLRAVVLVLPGPLAHALFKFIADLGFITIGVHRRRAIEHLQAAFPEMTREHARLIAKRMTRNLARNAVEFIHLKKLSKERLLSMVTISRPEIVEQLAREGRGAIALSAHIGNWELFAAAIVAMGFKMTVVAREIYYGKFESLVRGMRRRAGLSIVYRDQPREILRALRNGHFLATLADMDIEKLDSVYVEFFGRLALTPTGPVMLAMRTGVPLLPAFIVRNDDGTHTIVVEPPITLARTGDAQKDLLVNTMRAAKAIERIIRRYPEQWMWMHRRWQHQPQWPFLKTEGEDLTQRRKDAKRENL